MRQTPKTPPSAKILSLTRAPNPSSTNPLGGLPPQRIRPLADRAGLARLDVVLNARRSRRGQTRAEQRPRLGAQGAQADADVWPGGVPDV